MRHHRFIVSAALVAASAGLVPGTAHAADPVTPAARADDAPAGDTRTTAGRDDAHFEISLFAAPITAHEVQVIVQTLDRLRTYEIVYDWGDGSTSKVPSTGLDATWEYHTYAEVGAYTVTVTVKDTATGAQAVQSVKTVTDGTEYTPHAPTRLLDTRSGLGAAKAKVGGRRSVALKVAGTAAIPADVVAVALNVTVTNTVDAGHIAVQPGKTPREALTSNLNYVAGQSVPNLVIVPVRDGHVQMFNGGWQPVDLIADVTGYFKASAASGYTALPPVRAVDTREGLGTPKGQVPGYGTFDVAMAGHRGVPKGATAVALNLTATNPQESGHLTAYPGGHAVPATSNVNFSAGQTVANAVIVPIGPDGKITVRNGSWKPADVVIDVAGYYSPDSQAAFKPQEPHRIFDSRTDSWFRPRGPLKGRDFAKVPVFGRSDSLEAVVLNSTVTNTAGSGFLSVAADPNEWEDYETGSALAPERPVSSALNWTRGATVPNLVQAAAGKGQILDFWNQGWESADLVVDLLGYYDPK
ncbi:PKD domain-containing protein [Streptomyces sp. NPDC051546]|uniref:PKD domain-containing protein n=1 Tax=Streptomyces sp. NPDC051546 TaxID=3365655 RepID=UPI0037B67F8D